MPSSGLDDARRRCEEKRELYRQSRLRGRFLSGADLLAHGCIPEMEITPALHYHRLFVDHQLSLARVSRILQTASSVA